MAINTNSQQPADQQQAKTVDPSAGFSGTTLNRTAPMGGGDLMRLMSLASPRQIDATVKPYLDGVMAKLQDSGLRVELKRVDRMSNAYFIVHTADDGALRAAGLMFVPGNEPINQKFTPPSQNLAPMTDELKAMYADTGKTVSVVASEVVLGNYKGDMDRAESMGAYLARVFMATGNEVVKNATVDWLKGSQLYVSWNIAEARATEDRLSPRGTRKRIDIGATITAKLTNDPNADLNDQFVTLGVVGGYMDFREKVAVPLNDGSGNSVLKYEPYFVLTTIDAEIMIEGIAALMLAAVLPSIYTSRLWARQWDGFLKNQPQPGLLEEEPGTNKAMIIEDKAGLNQWLTQWTVTPQVVIQFQDGREAIPGMYRMGSPDPAVRQHFIDRVTGFFGVKDYVFQAAIAATVDVRIEGVYGDAAGVYHDSREIDYLAVAAKNGFSSISHEQRRVLLGGQYDAQERCRLLQDATGGQFRPVWLTSSFVLNPDLTRLFVDLMERNRITVVDPEQRLEVRPFSAMTSGFGSANGIGTIVTSAPIHGVGGNLNSVWYQR